MPGGKFTQSCIVRHLVTREPLGPVSRQLRMVKPAGSVGISIVSDLKKRSCRQCTPLARPWPIVLHPTRLSVAKKRMPADDRAGRVVQLWATTALLPFNRTSTFNTPGSPGQRGNDEAIANAGTSNSKSIRLAARAPTMPGRPERQTADCRANPAARQNRASVAPNLSSGNRV